MLSTKILLLTGHPLLSSWSPVWQADWLCGMIFHSMKPPSPAPLTGWPSHSASFT
ncbi:hypothetical protein SKAU_G00270220, partial [Synaphobranchus kaupii]